MNLAKPETSRKPCFLEAPGRARISLKSILGSPARGFGEDKLSVNARILYRAVRALAHSYLFIFLADARIPLK